MEVAATATARPHELVPQLQFPPGFRFVPTELELVDVYLRAKIEGHKPPLDVVNDVPILDWQPGKLVEEYKGYGENRWFFFAVREQSSSNKDKEPSRKVRVEGVTATWKATGSVQKIQRRAKDGGDKQVVDVGSKRVLIYNSSDANENGKWSMHEYILQGHGEIGQYALYSIQRKQHSDTQDNAGNDDMDPEKKKKKTRKRKRSETETPSTELEGVQRPHLETTTLLAEPPLKKPTRKPKAQRKKKPTVQVGVQGEQQKQQHRQSPMEPVTPPKKDEPTPPQQEGRQQQQPPPPPPVVLSAVPLQAVRAAPTLEEDTLDDMSKLWALLNNPLSYQAMLCNNKGQEQWSPSFAGTTAFLAAPDTNVVVDHAPFQPHQQEEGGYGLFAMQNQHLSLGENNQSVYMEQGWQHPDLMFLMDNTTQPMNSGGGGWENGDGQRHQIQIHQQQLQEENNGGAFGAVQDQQPMNHLQGTRPAAYESSSGSDDLQVFGESVQMDELEAFVRGVLVPRDEEPSQDLAAAGTQEQEGGDDPATLQAAGTQEQGADGTATLQSRPEHDDELQQQRLALLRLTNTCGMGCALA